MLCGQTYVANIVSCFDNQVESEMRRCQHEVQRRKIGDLCTVHSILPFLVQLSARRGNDSVELLRRGLYVRRAHAQHAEVGSRIRVGSHCESEQATLGLQNHWQYFVLFKAEIPLVDSLRSEFVLVLLDFRPFGPAVGRVFATERKASADDWLDDGCV